MSGCGIEALDQYALTAWTPTVFETRLPRGECHTEPTSRRVGQRGPSRIAVL